MAKVSELLDKVQDAVSAVEQKGLVVEQTKAAFDAASQDLQSAQKYLSDLQTEINAALGGLLGPQNTRVRVSA